MNDAPKDDSSALKPTIVVADHDPAFLDLFKNDGDIKLIRFLTASDRPSTQLLVADKKNFVAGILVGAKVCEPLSVPLVKFCKQHRPSTPVYLVLEEDGSKPEPDVLKSLHIAEILRKPLDRQDVTSKIFPYSYFEMEQALEIAKNDTTGLDQEMLKDDGDMHPILAKDLLCGKKSFFDIYVRISSSHYVKLLKAGDEFDKERVNEYIRNGVIRFYLKKEAQEVYLQYCDSLTGILLHKKDVGEDIKVRQVINYGKETEDFLKARGFNESTLLTAKQFVTHSEKLVKQLKPDKTPALKQFLSNIVLCEHATGMAMMSGLMLEAMKFTDEKVINTLALAAFLHDIGLVGMPEKFFDENEENMTPEESKLFRTHPIIGFEMARNIRMISPIIPASILEHHERRTSQGFPYGRGSGGITQFSEVIGIIDVFLNTLKTSSKTPGFNIANHMQQVVYNQFSFPVMDAFDKTFIKPLITPT